MSVLLEDCGSDEEEYEDAREEWWRNGVSVSGEVEICPKLDLSEERGVCLELGLSEERGVCPELGLSEERRVCPELGLSEDSRVNEERGVCPDLNLSEDSRVRAESDSEEFVDAEDSVEAAQGCRIDKNVEKALDTLLSYRGGRTITQEEVAHMYTSQKVHVGNVKYDLTRINLGQNQRLVTSQQVCPSCQDTQEASDELRIVSRQEWNAEPPMDILTPLKTPVPLVIICHTAGLLGFNQEENTHIIQRIQAYNTENLEWDDIGYNFLIGMDGLVYEGRGWLSLGAHTLGYNSLSIGVAFVGRFVRMIPSDAAMQAFHKLVAKGVQLGHIAPDYKLLGACQLRKTPTDSPGKAFYDVIVGWPHWAAGP